MMNRIGRERGWPPSGRPEYEALRSPRGALAAGSPEQVAEKILFEHELFGNTRYVGQMSVGAVAHADVLRSIELFGTEVAPVVRAEVARRERRAPAPVTPSRDHDRVTRSYSASVCAAPPRPRSRARAPPPAPPRPAALALAGSSISPCSAVAQRRRVAGRPRAAPRPVAATSEKPPMSVSTTGLAERQRGGQHAGLVKALGPRVRAARPRRRGETAPAPRRRRRTGRRTARDVGASARSGASSIIGRPTIHSSAPGRRPRHARSSVLDALVGPQQAEEQHHRPARPPASSRAAARRRRRGADVLERAVVDHVDLAGGDAEPRRRSCRGRIGVHDHRIDPVVAAAAGPAAWPGRGSRGSRSWAVSTSGRLGQQVARRATGSVSHWKWTTSAAAAQPPVAQHVGDVRRPAWRPGAPRARRARRRGGRTARARA